MIMRSAIPWASRITVLVLLIWAHGMYAAQPAGIEIHPGNPFYWQFDGKPVLLLGGSTGPVPHRTTGTPGLENDEGMFLWPDAIEALERLARVGGNYARCLMSGRVRGEPLWPFARTGGRYDLERWDPDYWQRFETFLQRAREVGIVVHVEIWATFDYGRAPWAANPFNPKNNINYTAESSGLPLADDVPHQNNSFYRTIPGSDHVPVVLGYQQRFVEKILAHTLRHDHVLYCIDNETRQSAAWGAYWCRYVRDIAAKADRKVSVTEMYGSHDLRDPIHNNTINHPELYDFVEAAQNNHQGGQSHYDALQSVRERIRAAPRPMNNVKIYGVDGGRFGTSKDAMERFWRNLFAGCASARFHEKHLGGSEPAQRMIKSAREVFSVFDVFHASPRNDLLSNREANEAYCLAAPPRQYAVYFPASGEVQLDLREAKGGVELRWHSIDGGGWMEAKQVQGEKPVGLATPGAGQWAAVLRSGGK